MHNYNEPEYPALLDSVEEIASTKRYTQWNILPDGIYQPTFNTIKEVPAGLYELKFNHSMGSMILDRKSFTLDELYELPSPEITEILKDIKTFWEKKNIFEKYNFVHKRGILLYGEPGCGKSGIIQLCIKHVIEEMNGVIFNIKDSDSIDYYIDYICTFREIEPNRPLIVILEDIDSIVGEDKYNTSQVLNILDGITQINNVVYIATTNYPDKLEERISARPSRFDRRYEISFPSDQIRKSYILNKLGQDFNDIDRWVKLTEGMSLAHLREIIISVKVFEMDLESIVKTLNGNKKRPKLKKDSNSIGFQSKITENSSN